MSEAHVLRNYLGGRFVELSRERSAAAEGEGLELLASVNPATGHEVARGLAPVSAVDEAVSAARAALPAWRRLGLEGRIEALMKVAERVAELLVLACELSAERPRRDRKGLPEGRGERD